MMDRDKITTPKSLQITDEALSSLIRWYCREAGVRNLEVSTEKENKEIEVH